MKVIILPNDKKVAKYAYQIVKDRLSTGINAIGLPSGETPLKLYAEIINGFKRGELDFSGVRAFATHEFLGVLENDDRSWRKFMEETLFSHVNINPDYIYGLNGMSSDYLTECQNYEDDMDYLGGIKLQILGLGTNGHIAYNEPGSCLNGHTCLAALFPESIAACDRLLKNGLDGRSFVLTIGVGTIMNADECLVLATGPEKAAAVAAMVEGPVSAFCPASALQYHNSCTLVIDEEAASDLQYKEYYKAIAEAMEKTEWLLANAKRFEDLE